MAGAQETRAAQPPQIIDGRRSDVKQGARPEIIGAVADPNNANSLPFSSATTQFAAAAEHISRRRTHQPSDHLRHYTGTRLPAQPGSLPATATSSSSLDPMPSALRGRALCTVRIHIEVPRSHSSYHTPRIGHSMESIRTEMPVRVVLDYVAKLILTCVGSSKEDVK